MSILESIFSKISLDADFVKEALEDSFDEWKEELHPRAGSGPHGGEFVPKGQGTMGVKEVAAEAHKRTHKSPVKFGLERKELSNGGRRITIKHGYMSTAIASEMKAKVEEAYKAIGGKVKQDRWTLIVDVDLPPKNQLTKEKKEEIKKLAGIVTKIQNPPEEKEKVKEQGRPKGEITQAVEGKKGGTEVVAAKNFVGGLKAKNKLIKLDIQTRANGDKVIKYTHAFNTIQDAFNNIDSIQKEYKNAYGKAAFIEVNRIGSYVNVYVRLKTKDGPPENESKIEVQKVSNNLGTLREERIKTTPIVSAVDLKPGEHVSETLKVKFSDGSSGVFKSSKGEPRGFEYAFTRGYQTAREVGAWEVAKLVGLDHIVTPCVKTNYKGEEGALLDWQNGIIANNANYDHKYDGDEDLAKAAIFDFVIGNSDRHGGNWLVDNSSGKPELRLIDHGLSFPDTEDHRGGGGFTLEISRRQTRGRKVDSLDKHKEIYKEKLDDIEHTLKKVGLPEGSIDFLKNRVDRLIKCKDWSYLK